MKEYNHNTEDALGNEIIMGNQYGYSNSSNGFTSIRIGTAKNFTESGLLSLIQVSSRRALYNDRSKSEHHRGYCSVKPSMLFPIPTITNES